MTNSRRDAAFAIQSWLLTKDFPNGLLPNGPDRAFVQDLVYTVIRRLRPLRKVLGELVKKWPKDELEALLYVGAAQILYMDEVPDYAAVSTTVEAAKRNPNKNVAKVTNGVLRNLIRRREEFERMLAESTVAERESYPNELYRRWETRFGAEKAEALAKWHNLPAETYLAYPDHFEKLARGRRVTDVPGYSEGKFIVQDPATAMAVEMVDAKEGDRVLDACAAPGGKCVRLAWKGAKLTACEVNPKRRRVLSANLARLGLAVPIVGSLTEVDDGAFTKVLADVPCSNSGVFRRRPDARWNWSVKKLEQLAGLQFEILETAARKVAAGGTLVYSTCSNEPEENQVQIERFIAKHPEFELKEMKESLPFETGCDGAFAAALLKGK